MTCRIRTYSEKGENMESGEGKKKKRRKKKLLIVLAALLLLAAAVPAVVMYVAKSFTAQETVVRTDWTTDVGEVFGRNEEQQVEYAQAELGDGIRVLQLVPMDIEEEGFTYYDISVQERLENSLEELKSSEMDWTAETPLAVLNPYGTGSNGLYLYFETELDTQVAYTIHVEDETISDYTATAARQDGRSYGRTHEFQLIGLVPGMTNEVTLTLTGSWGNVRQIVRFTVDMPDTWAMDFSLTTKEFFGMKWFWKAMGRTGFCSMRMILSPVCQMESWHASMDWGR